MASILELMDFDRIYADELLNMKKQHDEKVKQETIKEQVKKIIEIVKQKALNGKTECSIDISDDNVYQYVDEIIIVLREVFPDSDVTVNEQTNLQHNRLGIKKVTTILKIDWSE